MKMYLTLFRKEIKNMYRELILFFVLQIGFMMYSLSSRTFAGNRLFLSHSAIERLFVDIFDVSPYFITAALVYSIYLEERTGTLYQALSLPVKRVLLLTKFLVALGAMCMLTLFVIVYTYIGYTYIGFRVGYGKASLEAVMSGILGFLCYPFISLCLVCTAWGFLQLVRQNRLVVGLATGIMGFGFYIWLANAVKNFGVAYIDIVEIYSMSYNVVFTLITGGIFCLIGLFFYERYSEI